MIDFDKKVSISHLLDSYRKKQVSPSEVVHHFLKRIEEIDPKVKAWVRITKEDALLKAKKLEEDPTAAERLPLYGIPFGAKDIFYTKGVQTSAGSRVNPDFIPEEDATIIKKLTAAGAILLGKTTTTEYANWGAPPPTRNPWNLDHTPGGSSSGSAAALASNTAMFTLGTQTVGSLSRPAAYNGLTTLKGSFGLVSRYGVIPASHSLDHVGALTHSVEDTCLVFNEMLGYDKRDPGSLHTKVEKLLFKQTSDLTTVTIGVPQDYFFEDLDPIVSKVFNDTLDTLAKLGATLIPFSMPPTLIEVNQAHEIVMKTEVARFHHDMFKERSNLYSESMQEVIRFGLSVSEEKYNRAQKVRERFRYSLVSSLKNVDAIVTPATPTTAPYGIHSTGSPHFNGLFTNAGVPTLTIPAGYASSLPIGIQLVSNHFMEQKLIDIGTRFQQETDFHLHLPMIK